MPYIEMTIDSVRHAMHKDTWLILLKDKSGQRCLPAYVDKVWADAVGKVLKGEDAGEVIDEDGDNFKARFVGQGDDIECSVGKALAICAKASGPIFVEEAVLSEASITTEC